MSQEPLYNKNDKNIPTSFGNCQNGEDPNTPKKGPKFSIYWIYAIIFAVLIGFQLFSPFSPSTATIDQDRFLQILKAGDVESYTVVSNRNLVKVTLKKSALPRYNEELKKSISGKPSDSGPQMSFKVVSGDSFKDDMREFYTANPGVKDVGKVDTESDWFSKSISFLLPILLFVGLWILLMRKMGGSAGGGGGPGGIFNIGKSKATLFDKGTRVN